MSKSSIDSEVNNQIFRKDYPVVIAKRRELASLAPVRLAGDGADFIAGTAIARETSSGKFKRWTAVSGGTYDTPCVLFESVPAYQFDSAVTGGALARAVVQGYVYQGSLVGSNTQFITALGGVIQTDASQVAIVKF